MADKGPVLSIDANDYTYIKACVKKAGNSEVGGLGIIVLDDNGYPCVAHHRLLKQEVSSASVDWDETAHSDYLEWLYTPEEEGGAGFTGNSYGLYSWHSHGNMSTYYSGTDEDFIRRVGQTAPYIFSSVFNVTGSVAHRLDVFATLEDKCPILNGKEQITWKDCNLFVVESEETSPVVVKITDIEESFKEAIEKMKAERDAALKGLREELTTLQKGVVKEISAQVDEDFKTYVKMSRPTSGWNKHQPGGGAGNKSTTKNGNSSSSPKALTPGSHKQESGSGDKGKDATSASDATEGDGGVIRTAIFAHLKGIIVRAYDTTACKWGEFSLADILADDDLVPATDIPQSIIEALPDEYALPLVLRPTHEEWLDETVKSYGSTIRYS